MRLGEILMERRQITQEDLDRALELQRERGDKLGKILVDLGFIAQRDVLSALAEQLQVPVLSIEGPPAVFARARNALAPLPAPVPLPSGRPARSHRHAGHGRSAGFRNSLHGGHLHRSRGSGRASRPNRKSSTPSTATTARARRTKPKSRRRPSRHGRSGAPARHGQRGAGHPPG